LRNPIGYQNTINRQQVGALNLFFGGMTLVSAEEIADSLKGINPRIRKRRSYRYFKKLYKWLKTNPTPEEVLWKVYEILDRSHAFGSVQNAMYARESIELIVQDA